MARSAIADSFSGWRGRRVYARISLDSLAMLLSLRSVKIGVPGKELICNSVNLGGASRGSAREHGVMQRLFERKLIMIQRSEIDWRPPLALLAIQANLRSAGVHNKACK